MTRCRNGACPSTDIKPYRQYLGKRIVLLCDACHASLSAIGMDLTLVERRVEDVQPLTERRRLPKPRWLENLTSRDDTWRMSA